MRKTAPSSAPWYDAGERADYSEELVDLTSVPDTAVCKVASPAAGRW